MAVRKKYGSMRGKLSGRGSKVTLVAMGKSKGKRKIAGASVMGTKKGGNRKATNYRGYKTIGVNKMGKSLYKFPKNTQHGEFKGVYRHQKTIKRNGNGSQHQFVNAARPKTKVMVYMTNRRQKNGKMFSAAETVMGA